MLSFGPVLLLIHMCIFSSTFPLAYYWLNTFIFHTYTLLRFSFSASNFCSNTWPAAVATSPSSKQFTRQIEALFMSTDMSMVNLNIPGRALCRLQQEKFSLSSVKRRRCRPRSIPPHNRCYLLEVLLGHMDGGGNRFIGRLRGLMNAIRSQCFSLSPLQQ